MKPATLALALSLMTASLAQGSDDWGDWQEDDLFEQDSALQLNKLDQSDLSEFKDSNWQPQKDSLKQLSELDRWNFEAWSENFDAEYSNSLNKNEFDNNFDDDFDKDQLEEELIDQQQDLTEHTLSDDIDEIIWELEIDDDDEDEDEEEEDDDDDDDDD